MRAMKRLVLVALFALPMVMTGCEKLGDATGPEMSKVPSAAQVSAEVEVTDSTYFEAEAGATAPTPPEVIWP